MEGRVEAGHLRQVGEAPEERLDQGDLLRDVIWVHRADTFQVDDHSGVIGCASV